MKLNQIAEVVCVTSLPMGGDRTMAKFGLPDHYLLPAYEIAASLRGISPDDISHNPLQRYQFVAKTNPAELSARALNLATAQNLSHVAITGCANQPQITALKEEFGGADFYSVWLATPPRSVYEAFVRRASVTGITCPMAIGRIIDEAQSGGMDTIRGAANAVLGFQEGRLGGNTPQIMRRALNKATGLAA